MYGVNQKAVVENGFCSIRGAVLMRIGRREFEGHYGMESLPASDGRGFGCALRLDSLGHADG
jgi:hypothetical protein